MIQSKKELKFYLFADRVMRYGLSNMGGAKSLWSNDYIFSYLVSMRWSAYFNNCVGKKKYLNPLYWYHTRRFTRLGVKLGFSIGVNSLGYGAVLPHYGTIVVNGDCTLGNYCVLHTSHVLLDLEK